jgi:hypothetical protein
MRIIGDEITLHFMLQLLGSSGNTRRRRGKTAHYSRKATFSRRAGIKHIIARA